MLGCLVVGILIFFFERYGNVAIVFASVAMIVFSLVLSLLVMPLDDNLVNFIIE